jgi:hypothetical protein
MKTIVLAIVAGAGILLITSLQASATPANGAAIAERAQVNLAEVKSLPEICKAPRQRP